MITVRLTDQENRTIDLNGLDWDISLSFDFIETSPLRIPKDKRLEVEDKQYKKFKELKEKTKKKK